MTKTKEVFHRAGWYASAFAATQFVTVVAAVLMRRFLGPVQVGVWALVQVILSYAEYLTLGVASAIPREIPFHLGKGEIDQAASMKQNSLNFTMLVTLIASLAMMAYAFWSKSHISPELFWGLLFASALMALQQLNNILIVFLRAYQKFDLAGRQMFFSAIVNALLVAVLSYRFRLFGFMTAMCLSFVFNILYIFYHEKFSFCFRIDFRQIRNLIVYGFPLMILALLGTLLQTLDRMVISKFLGLELLGIYSIAAMTNGFVFSFPNSVGVVLLSSISETFGQNKNRQELRHYLQEADSIFTTLMPVLIGMAWFVVPLAIQAVLPKFTEGITALKFLVLSSFFMAVAQAYGNFIIAIRKQAGLFPVAGITLISQVIVTYFVLARNGGIEGVAIAQTLAYGINFTLLFFLSHHHLDSWAMAFRHYAVILLKFFWMVLLLSAISSSIRVPHAAFCGILQMACFTLAYIPFLIRLEKRYHVAKIIMRKLGFAQSASSKATFEGSL